MRKITKIECKERSVKMHKRVAAYARVSRDTERLMHSVSAQISFYSNLIQNNPDWVYAGVYADCGITGTLTSKRDEFKHMIEDCEKGKIDIILTKSISRFARNTVDLLETVRHLKNLGVEVRFEKENINSMSADGELMLTILASFAQEESSSISENVKWGIRKRFQSGEIGAANKHILGYKYDDEQKKYIIVPEEAKAVKQIFQMFIDGVSYREIADKLTQAGIKTVLCNNFQEASLRQLIFNEIYAGDIKRQKTYTADPIKKIKVKNKGELPEYYIKDCHDAIIDREMYAKVQAEMKRRTELLNPVYCFTGKIKCGCCGSSYTRKRSFLKGREYVSWICRNKKDKNVTCSSPNFKESLLKSICSSILETDCFDESFFESQVKNMTVLKNGDIEFHLIEGKTKLWKNIHIDEFRHKPTLTNAFQNKILCSKCGNIYHRVCSANKWVYWYCIGKKKKGCTCDSINFADFRLRRITEDILGIKEFNEDIFAEKIEKITVLEDGSLEYKFYEGSKKVWQKM